MNDKEAYFLEQIASGPNAKLYERLMQYKNRFTLEQVILGVTPLFFGKKRSLEIAEAFLNISKWGFKEYMKEKEGLSVYEQEKDRIQELINGEFELPSSVDRLLKNADKWITNHQETSEMIENGGKLFAEEIKASLDRFYKPVIKVLKEVKQKIIELRNDGLLE